jgi:hypothetical protein
VAIPVNVATQMALTSAPPVGGQRPELSLSRTSLRGHACLVRADCQQVRVAQLDAKRLPPPPTWPLDVQHEWAGDRLTSSGAERPIHRRAEFAIDCSRSRLVLPRASRSWRSSDSCARRAAIKPLARM